MSEAVMVMATMYQLNRRGGEFVKDGMLKVRDLSLVERSLVSKYNDVWTECGKWYEVDEDATTEAYNRGKEKKADIQEAEAEASELNEMVLDSLKEVKKKGKKRNNN